MSKEFKVGLIALLAGAVLYWGFNYLKGTDFFNPTNRYYVIYDNVDGLNKSNPVIINGLAVGRVSAISLIQSADNAVLVELDIDENVVLGTGSTAKLSNTDLLGSKGIILSLGDIGKPLEPGDTLTPAIDPGLEAIIETVNPITTSLNTTITSINEILLGMKGSGELIYSTIDELENTLIRVNRMIGRNQEGIAEIVASTALLVENMNQRIDQLEPLLENSNELMDSLNSLQLNRTLAGVDTVLYNLNETLLYLQESDGTLGKLVQEDSLYNNLNQLLLDLDKLVIHFDQYPRDFLKPLGRKHKKLEGAKED